MSPSTDPADEPCNFNKLPPELRTEIWKLAASNDRNVLLISDRNEATVTIPPPVIAWICRESRVIAFQYGHVYRVGDRLTWFSPEFDRLVLDALWTSRRDSLGEVQVKLKVIAKSLVNDVRHALSPPDGSPHRISSFDIWARSPQINLWPIIAACPNLQTIGVIGDAGIVSGGIWTHSEIGQSIYGGPIPASTVIHELETETQMIDEVSTKPFRRSSPSDWMDNSADNGNMGNQSSQPIDQRRFSLVLSQPAWRREKEALRWIWDTWFHHHLTMLTPTTLSDLTSYAWTSDRFSWMNQVKDRAPLVYPAVLVAYGDRLLRVESHPAFTENELRQLQHHAMQAWFVDTFGDQALADADAGEEAAT